MREITRFHLIFTICMPTIAKAILSSEKECTPHSFSPPYRWEGRVYYTIFPLQYGGNLKMCPTLFFPHRTDGKEECTPHSFFPTVKMERKSVLHSFSPSVRWKFENVPHTLFFSHHTDGEKECTPHSFSPPYRWRERVYYTLFSHRNKMEKKRVPPTLFFPIIEGKNIQRVSIYPNPFRSPPS